MRRAEKSAADILADAGRALYGEHWRLALARALQVDDDTIRRWMSGRTPFRVDHPVFVDLLDLLRRRQSELGETEASIRDWLRKSPHPSL